MTGHNSNSPCSMEGLRKYYDRFRHRMRPEYAAVRLHNNTFATVPVFDMKTMILSILHDPSSSVTRRVTTNGLAITPAVNLVWADPIVIVIALLSSWTRIIPGVCTPWQMSFVELCDWFFMTRRMVWSR